MGQTYTMSAGTLLYAVLKLHKSGIYGLPNVMPKMSDKSFPGFAQDSESELMNAGCGLMNFDGEFVIEPEFAALMAACADCQSVVGVSLHQNGEWRKLTVYPNVDAVIERSEDYICTLKKVDHPVEVMLKALAMPENPEKQPCEILVDTDLLEKKDTEGIMATGCSEEQANMIISALNGTGRYAHISHVESKVRTGELLLIYGDEGLLYAEAEYSETKEFLRFKPMRAEDAAEILRTWTKKGE